MATNELQIRRVAHANFTVPTSILAAVSDNMTVNTDVYIPAGAIVTGVRYFTGGAVTLAGASDATITPYVSAQALVSNNNKLSVELIQTVMLPQVLVHADGIVVPTGGLLAIAYGTTGAGADSLVANADVYVEYLYCPDRDIA